MNRLLVAFLFCSVIAMGQTPSDYPGLELWLRSDMGLVTDENDRVAEWEDQSGAGNNATQTAINFRPIEVPQAINGLPGVRFDGENDRLDFPEIDNIRTVLWVLREDEDAGDNRVPLLCHSSLFDFHRGDEWVIWHPNFSNEAIRNGVTRLNGEVIEGTETALPGNFSLVSLQTTDNVSANRFSFDRTFGTRMWDGDLLEIIVYSEALSPEEVEALENYLFEKYAPTLIVSDNLEVEYGFCPSEISANEGFESYLWSTGDTEPSISVNNSGDYWVEVTDVFGRAQRDTIQVTYPGNTSLQDTAILCVGDSIQWDLELPEEGYSIEWFLDGQSTSNWFSTAGDYTALITDDNQCSLTTPVFTVEVDDFATQVGLGPDLDLCAGNSISLQGELEEGLSYLWGDDSTDPSLVIEETGEYSVSVTNLNGCELLDTIQVAVIGTAPEVALLLPPIACVGTEQEYGGSAIADSPIVGWEWDFNGESQLEGQQVEWNASEFGLSTVALTVTSESGCSTTASAEVYVHPQPEASVILGQACAFSDLGVSVDIAIAEGIITEVLWEFAGQEAEGEEVVFQPIESGFEELNLTLTSAVGCSTQLSQFVNVLAAPEIVISAENTCIGTLTSFDIELNTTASGEISDWYWTFGDGGFSTLSDPQHLYPNPGSYDVQVTVTAENGCSRQAATESLVIPLPQADFVVANACIGTPYETGESSASSDPIVEWSWTYSEGSFNGEDYQPVFTQLGFNPLTLLVTTDEGCQDEITQQVPVFDLPEAAFSFDPIIGAPPLAVNFLNESAGAVSFDWTFGDGGGSIDSAPQHIFEEEGTFELSLVATNIYGCQDTAIASIDVTEPIVDLEIIGGILEETPNGLLVSIGIINRGNYPISETLVSVILSDGNRLTEVVEDILEPGFLYQHEFQTLIQPNANHVGYVCAEVKALNALALEATPINNRFCLASDVLFEFPPIYPNPIAQGEPLNLVVIGNTGTIASLRILDSNGRVCFSTDQFRIKLGYNEWQWFLPQLRTGSYIVELKTENTMGTQRLLVE